MLDNGSKGISYIAGFFMLIAFAIAGAILAGFIYAPIWTSMTGKSIKALGEGLIGPGDSDAMKIVQSISAIVGFFLPAVFTAWLISRRPMRLLGFSTRIRPGQIGLVVFIMLLALLVSSGLSYLNHSISIPADWKRIFDKMELDYNRQVEAIVGLNDLSSFLVSIVVMAFLPALCEETLFRGGLQNFLARSTRNSWFAIIAVSLIFSAVHFSYYGFIPRLFLGMVLGLIYHYSGRLWLSIIAHFTNNVLALSMLYYYKSQGKPLQEAVDQSNESVWGLFALPLVIGLFIYFKKVSSKREPENYESPGSKFQIPNS